MADQRLKPDPNWQKIMGAVTDDVAEETRPLLVDPSTGRLKVDASVSLTIDAQKVEDAAHASGATGSFVLAVRNDAATALTTTDGDYSPFAVDSAGRMGVADLGGTLTVDAPVGTPVFVRLSDGSSAIATLPVSLASVPSHAVTNAGVFAVQVDGAALTSLQLIDDAIYAEDVASQGADKMMAIAAKRLDTPVANALVSGDGDYLPFITDNLGKLWTADNQIEDAAHASGDRGSFVLGVSNEANTARAADGDYIAFATDTEGNQRIIGNRDHDAVDAGEVVKIGGFATTTNQTRVASGDRAHFITDLAGRQIANLGQVRELRGKQTTTISASTSETTIVTAAASTFKDLVALIISNTSATAVRVDVRDTTAGTILFSLYIPAGDVRGFVLPGVSIPQTTVNTNWTAQSSASVTDLRILAIFENNT